MQSISYRTIIQEEFNYRVKENASYSLRAFSRDLTISPSQLSEVLKGKIGLGSKKALEVAKHLGLNDQEGLYFKALVEIEHGRSPQIVESAKKFISTHAYGENFRGLGLDGFKIIADWCHFAILSTMELDDYDGTIPWIAKRLNLSLTETEDAVKRMLKLDYLDLKDGKFVVADIMLASPTDIPSSALKNFHKQHINKSLRAIDDVAVELRDITCMTMAIDVAKIPQAKEMIKNFRRELCRFMESGEKNEVYNINIQLIPLTTTDDLCKH